ncbi:NRDE family protein [Tuwongella immobilis]|uniref:NRDE family protein n=1 Tax=Tuwongella immobilis TaxID=692036 RepID=A0A6C2YVR6_9BACT|nr:NRDE family protein [Tuwongella immobilis]VIP05263.1 Protein containing DUF833 OS=Rhodopirellula maiorica SM1 GN=RMSM_02627 PE=4 SV=1: NRDE [Tuwongella immobilis]VTS07882.1 Protein containing DUF833 OS=Rhodopirellula maiorica SM1 GN=RMSM_02627 PE=4 SV=1: NRDE [Tuwongella immobilis]
MCLIALLHHVVDDWPVIVAANREEAYARGGTPPQIWTGQMPFLAGRDPKGGGTWLGINRAGLVVAVTNRRRSHPDSPMRSRGLLVTDLLAHETAADAEKQAIAELSRTPYDGCNLLLVDSQRATVIHHGDWLRVRPLPPGLHVLANRDVNDETDARCRFVFDTMISHRYPSVDAAFSVMESICRHHEPPTPICLRGPERGTVSSTILGISTDIRNSRLLHAQGPPDRTIYFDQSDWISQLLQEPN